MMKTHPTGAREEVALFYTCEYTETYQQGTPHNPT